MFKKSILIILLAVMTNSYPTFDGKITELQDGSFEAYLEPPFPSNHASFMEEFPDDSLGMAWFSGVQEGKNLVSIVYTKLQKGQNQWPKALNVSGRYGYSNQNPVLYYDNLTKLTHLFHSQQPADQGEFKAIIQELTSLDYGQEWSGAKNFIEEPGSFPKNRIVQKKDKSLIFPYYRTFTNPDFSVYALSTQDHKRWRIDKPLRYSEELIQPSIIKLCPNNCNTWKIYYRDRLSRHIYASISKNEGDSWDQPRATSLPNNDAGIVAYTLQSGNIIMIYNDCTQGRTPLTIALSDDEGDTWKHKKNIQVTDDTQNISDQRFLQSNQVEFSYPNVIQTRDGYIHVSYTYDRKTIKYRKFTEDWIMK